LILLIHHFKIDWIKKHVPDLPTQHLLDALDDKMDEILDLLGGSKKKKKKKKKSKKNRNLAKDSKKKKKSNKKRNLAGSGSFHIDNTGREERTQELSEFKIIFN